MSGKIVIATKSDYTMKNAKEFIEQFKNINTLGNSKLVSFEVSLLFTIVPFDYTTDIILRRIYRVKEINTRIYHEEMRELLLLCTKIVHFS